MSLSPTKVSCLVTAFSLLAVSSACGGRDIELPERPHPTPPHRESDDWVKPEKNIQLKGGLAWGHREGTFRVVNLEPFAWTLAR
jgi:hypothetical protein